MYSKNRRKGNLGESIACLFLMKQGFKIIERNYLKPWGEIDIIARRNEVLHFIEVKSVSCETAHPVSHEISIPVTQETFEKIRPEENLTEKKLGSLKRAIQTYCIEHKLSHLSAQASETLFHVDLVTVRIDHSRKEAWVGYFSNVL